MEPQEQKSEHSSESIQIVDEQTAKRVHIVLAVDDDEESERAVHWAMNHFTGPCFGFSLLHAYNYSTAVAAPPVVGMPFAYASLQQVHVVQQIRDEAEKQARRLLQHYHRLFKEDKRPLEKCVAHKGSAGDVILSFLQANPYDLLIVGCRVFNSPMRKGLTGLSRWVSSVSYYCLYNAPCTTLLVKSCSKVPNTGSRRVVICLDGCAHSEKAFKWACDNFVQAEDEVVLVSACPYDKLDTETATQEQKRSAEVQTQEYLATFEKKMRDHHNKCNVVVKAGHPGQVIVSEVDKGTAEPTVDLLVMGSRGMGLLQRTFKGSVVDYCAAHTCVPMVIVKSQKPIVH